MAGFLLAQARHPVRLRHDRNPGLQQEAREDGTDVLPAVSEPEAAEHVIAIAS